MWGIVFLVLGLVGLCFGAATALNATVAIGERHGLSELFLGLTVLAIGSDLPEIVVAIDGGLLQLRGIDAGGVVVGNAIGSAVANAGLVLGLVSVARPIALEISDLRRDGGVLVLAIALFALVGFDGQVGRFEGVALTLAYATYLVALVRGAAAREDFRPDWSPTDTKAAFRILGGFVVLMLSAEVVLSTALVVADAWQVSPTAVGALIVGPGTSLPELGVSVAAIMKGKAGMSVGNIIGSNILDVLLPVGLCAAIAPVAIDREVLVLDLPAVFLLSTLVVVWSFGGERLGRIHGGVLIGAYGLYAGIRIVA